MFVGADGLVCECHVICSYYPDMVAGKPYMYDILSPEDLMLLSVFCRFVCDRVANHLPDCLLLQCSALPIISVDTGE